ncbi:MAG: methyltransferase, TIGR04325 family [Campylobacterales bacterium]|nr:methyltransferase, TIGR04325 family [Campylobacterales bacterium]
MKDILKKFIPPVVFDLVRKIKKSPYGWHGACTSWSEARRISDGYAKSDILEKVKNSLMLVKEGKAVYERDSVLFDSIQYSWPLLSGLMLGAARNGGNLSVLDFGGSLGSTYYQNRKFLNIIGSVEWSIVEQPNFVACGKEHFESKELKFYWSVEQCLSEKKPNVLLLSSVLQYIEEPYALLDYLIRFGFDVIIIDRTQFSTSDIESITIQRVPPSIYEASYPCRILDIGKIKSRFIGYSLLEEFDGADIASASSYCFKGMIYVKN